MKNITVISRVQLVVIAITLMIVFPLSALHAQDWRTYVNEQTKGHENNFYAVQKAFNDFWKDKTPEKGVGYKQFRRWEWYWEQRINADGSFPPNDVVVKEWNKYIDSHGDNLQATGSTGNWTAKGPNTSIGGYAGLGRTNCIAFHPTDFNTFWVGTPAGGLWKTTNFGATWTTNTDNMPVLGVSDIAINPTNPNIMYIATGDGDGGSLSACTGSPNGDTKSIGILKSTDGGNTWNATGMNWSVTDAKLIRRLIINPNDPNILYAAASDGIWKTTNGGIAWVNIFETNPVSYFMDIEFKPGSPNTLYASTYTWDGNAEVKMTNDAGTTWFTTNLVDDIIRIDLAISPASPDLVEGICANTNGAFAGWVESTNSFTNYTWYAAVLGTGNLLSGEWPKTATSTTGQGSYDLAYAMNPTNSNERWLGGVVTYKTNDGWNGNSNLVSFWAPGNGNPGVPVVHADKHFIAYHPLNPSYIFECNDGGLYWTNNGGTSWNDITNGLQISQIYRIGNSSSDSEDIMCGLQDNGSKEYYLGGWYDVTGGDGMECIIDPVNGNIVYSSYVNGEIYRTLDGWGNYITISENLPGGQQAGSWVTPYILDPNNPEIIYAGYADVYKSANRGNSWVQISNNLFLYDNLTSLVVAPSNSQFIYTSDFWHLYKTTNGGNSWTEITSGLPTEPARITYLAVSPTDPNTIFATFSGYAFGYKVFKSTNGGSTWSNISGTLPNLPVNCIVYQTGSNEGLYIGTDVGVYYKNATMSDWVYFSTNLPNVVVTELEIHYGSGKLRAATFGRGLWESDLYVATNSEITTNSNPTNGGTTSGGGTFVSGAQCTVSATANPSWTFVNWTENGNVVSSATSYTFSVNGDRTLTANFTQQQTYNIVTSANPTIGGTTTGGGTFTSGQQCTLVATTNTGYDFTNWTENGNIVSTASTYSFAVTANRTLVANFSIQQFTVTTIANPTSGGTTSGGGTFVYGTTITVVASANSSWIFNNWSENGNIVSTNPSYSFSLSTNRNLVGNFTQQGVQYTITATANPTNGGYTNGGGAYNTGVQATVNAFNNSGWAFFNWTEYGSQVSTSPTYTFTVSANRDLTANFLQQYIITATATPTNAGYTSGGGSFTSGQIATVQAFANQNYAFYRWMENGNVVSSLPSYSFTVTGNRNLTAVFLSTVGLNEQLATGIAIYPNPAQDLLTVEIMKGYSYNFNSLEIVNATGQLVLKLNENISSNKTNIDVGNLTNGVYFLKINMENGNQKTFRFLIKK